MTWVCDGSSECPNDEEHCYEKNGTCGSNRFLCSDRIKCIPLNQRWVLNSKEVHWGEGSEENCFDSLFLLWSCELNTFFSLFRCNMNADCVDGSDEKGCERLKKNRMCQKNQFTCSDGKCVNVHNVCDGIEVKDFWIWNNHTKNMSWFETEILHDIELFFWWRWEGLPKAWTCYMPFRPIQMLG